MVNFRVRDLDKMVAQLRTAGIEVKIDPQSYPNRRFARPHDPSGMGEKPENPLSESSATVRTAGKLALSWFEPLMTSGESSVCPPGPAGATD
jgi:hypothetical protein